MTVKINSLELENVKRIKAVQLEPAANGLTIIGGKNGQGKTSVLDAIAWALGGDRRRPSQAQRQGSAVPPTLKVTLSNGLIVERGGKNGTLKVIDPTGKKSGQQLLNTFISEFALDIPKFIQATSKEKAEILLRIIGVGDQLVKLDFEEKQKYDERRAVGHIADQKKKYAKEMVSYPDAPTEYISAAELIKQQQNILARNGENQRLRDNAQALAQRYSFKLQQYTQLKAQLDGMALELEKLQSDLETANMSAKDLHDESTAEIEASLKNIEATNNKVRSNLAKKQAEEEAEKQKEVYDQLTAELETIRNARIELLKNANLPLPELSVEDNEITYKGQKWDNMSASEQLKVAAAIVQRLNPECGFVLMDKLEQMDMDTLNEFGEWLKEHDLQVIATRVSTGDECSILIEDGYSVEPVEPAQVPVWQAPQSELKQWVPGQF